MAVALATKTNPTYEGDGVGETLVVTHPSSLATGDLLIACISEVDADANATPPAPSATDWTQIATLTQASPGPGRLTALYKTATAGDVSAGSTTFQLNITGSNDVWCGGAIYRITGAGSPASIQSAIGAGSGLTPSFSGLTPTFADSLLLMFMTQFPTATGSFSSYAIATDNPTWTEQFDSYGDAGGYGGLDDIVFAGASASRTQTTSTGNFTATTTLNEASIGLLVCIPPVTGVTSSPAVVTSTLTVQAPSVTGSVAASPAVVVLAGSVPAPTVTTEGPDWTNPNKSATATFTNPNKS